MRLDLIINQRRDQMEIILAIASTVTLQIGVLIFCFLKKTHTKGMH